MDAVGQSLGPVQWGNKEVTLSTGVKGQGLKHQKRKTEFLTLCIRKKGRDFTCCDNMIIEKMSGNTDCFICATEVYLSTFNEKYLKRI